MSTFVQSEVKPYADRDEDLQLVLDAVAAQKGLPRVLVLHGATRVGKSLLLRHAFKGSKSLGFGRLAFIDCEATDKVSDFVASISQQLDWPFPRTAEANGARQLLEVNRNQVKGDMNIAVHFQDFASLARDQEDRLLRAFRDDLRELARKQTVVLFMDHVDRATSSISRLVLNHLLPTISGLDTLRLIVCSRGRMDGSGLWDSVSGHFEVGFIRDAGDWAEYFRAVRGLEVPVSVIEILIRACGADVDIFLGLIRQYCQSAPEGRQA